jgi:hypothetical protein
MHAVWSEKSEMNGVSRAWGSMKSLVGMVREQKRLVLQARSNVRSS